MNVENLRRAILNIEGKERIALKPHQSRIGHVDLSIKLVVALTVSSLSAVIFAAFSIAILLVASAALVASYTCYHSAPHLFQASILISIAHKQLAAQFRPIHSWITDSGILATPKIKSKLLFYGLK